MRSDSRQSGSDTDRRSNAMRGLGMGGCGWPPFVDCHSRDDEEEYYGSDPRPRSLAFEDKEPKLQVGLDAVSLTSTASSLRTPQCRICFQGPEQMQSPGSVGRIEHEALLIVCQRCQRVPWMVVGGDAEPKPGFLYVNISFSKQLNGSKDNWSKVEWSLRCPFLPAVCFQISVRSGAHAGHFHTKNVWSKGCRPLS
ncbi:hypothetical protein XENOCAPTIV_025941 [Xenoophorus captivus]|uniref:Uncharacterized protein n=1 Tax=Xenoophorus captivus TaxID=1517983 RepID=A0ABV0RLY4_9TELE